MSFKVNCLNLSLILSALSSFANASEKLVIRAERDYYGKLQQQALVYDQEEISFSRNSDFFCEEGSKTTVGQGLYSKPHDENSKADQKLLEQIFLRLKSSSNAGRKISTHSAHSIHYYLGHREISKDNPSFFLIKSLLKKACSEPKWEKRNVEK